MHRANGKEGGLYLTDPRQADAESELFDLVTNFIVLYPASVGYSPHQYIRGCSPIKTNIPHKLSLCRRSREYNETIILEKRTEI